jgi:hypothetical protein
MSELSWRYSEAGVWWALPGNVNFRISITECGTFVAQKYIDNWLACESRWKTLDQAKDWCRDQRIGGGS